MIDLAPRLPDPSAEASSGEGVAVLQAPTDSAQAHEIVRRFFRAVVEESTADIDSLLSESAGITLTSTGHLPARAAWRARLARLDYRPLENQQLYREGEVETYREVAGTPPRRQAGPIPVTVSGEDLLLRVPMLPARAGSTRLFGDELWFLLKPGPNGYRIAELIENFQIP